MSGLVAVERSGPVATVTLSRPDRHNSLIPELLRELLEAITSVGSDGAAGAIVLAAQGRSFSTGGDVRGFYEAKDLAGYAAETVGLLNEVILRMLAVEKPIVCAVHGTVTGGSMGLLLGSDVVLMAPEATITPWYAPVGYSPDGGWTAILPSLIGRKRVAAVLLGNRTITAEDAVAWGIANDIVPADQIRSRAEELATEIAAMKATAGAKRLLGGDTAAIAAGLEEERKAFVAQIITPEARRGMATFLGEGV